MVALEIIILLLGWVAIFGLLIVIPWVVVRVTVGLLEADAKTKVAHWLTSVPEPERDRTDTSTTGVEGADRQSGPVQSEQVAQDR